MMLMLAIRMGTQMGYMREQGSTGALLALKGVSICPAAHVRYRPAPQKSCTRGFSLEIRQTVWVWFIPHRLQRRLGSSSLAQNYGGAACHHGADAA